MHEIYEKFCELSRIRMSIPELRILWHLSDFQIFNVNIVAYRMKQKSKIIAEK